VVEPDDDTPPPAKAKTKEKARTAEKVAAKGVEDEDVPYPTTPSQAVVRLEDGKLIVRQRGRTSHASQKEVDGVKYVVHETKTGVVAKSYDADDVSVFDMKGNRVAAKAWKSALKTDQHVLVQFDGRLPLPRELQLFKDDTLLIVFPGSGSAPGAYSGVEGFWTPGAQGQGGNNVYQFRGGTGFAPPAPPAVPALPAQLVPPTPPTARSERPDQGQGQGDRRGGDGPRRPWLSRREATPPPTPPLRREG